MPFLADLKFALRSLARNKGLSLTVVATLALGIGANAAIFSVVRGVLLRPLVNRDEGRLIYIRQSEPGIGVENMAFSVPEIQDLRERVKTLSSFGEFSTIGFTMVGLGEPRTVRAGVVNGSYFDVMGLHPVLGRLLNEKDDGKDAAGAAVLTYRFWTTALHNDSSVIGKTVRLGTRSATIVGVLEPSVPYPSETELIANIVTSPHHLSATMVTGRVHRMTELFGRLAPNADLDAARAELRTVESGIVAAHPEAYSKRGNTQISAMLLRDQITSRARTVLLVLLAASGLVFIIAVSNVANLILARTVRRESELTVRAALGASKAVLRRTLLAESLLLCGTGAVLGVLIAQPMVSILARYAARFSVRALDLTLDVSVLWVGVGLALAASVLLAFIPRLPVGTTPGVAGVRITGSTNRRLRAFAVTQIAASFVLLAGAGMLLKTLMALQAADPGFRTHNVLAVNVPVMSYGRTPEQVVQFYREVQRRVAQLPGVQSVASANQAPWRDAGNFTFNAQFTVEGRQKENGEEDPRARFRSVSPGYFATLGVPLLAGRDFTANDDAKTEKVVIISQTLAQTVFPGQDPVNRHLMWTDPVMKFIDVSTGPRRIIAVVPDIDDEHVDPQHLMAVYHPVDQEFGGGRLLVQTAGDANALAPTIARTIRDLSNEQPVERAATLDDIKAEVLAPDRLNTIVFGGFAIVALAISIVGVGGVLAFSVSGRTREFGIRLAVGSQPSRILTSVVTEGAVMAALGIVVGVAAGWAGARVVASLLQQTQMPGVIPIAGAALLLVVAAVVASVLPAARAARVDVMQALRSE
jgi:predicted permease